MHSWFESNFPFVDFGCGDMHRHLCARFCLFCIVGKESRFPLPFGGCGCVFWRLCYFWSSTSCCQNNQSHSSSTGKLRTEVGTYILWSCWLYWKQIELRGEFLREGFVKERIHSHNEDSAGSICKLLQIELSINSNTKWNSMVCNYIQVDMGNQSCYGYFCSCDLSLALLCVCYGNKMDAHCKLHFPCFIHH